MSARLEARRAVTALLTVDGGGSAWAIPGSAVVGVEPFEAGSSEAALDVAALLGAAPADAQQACRVVVVQVFGQRLRLLARGALTLSEAELENLLPLPALLTERSPLVSHVAVVDGKPALFVVSPELLLRARPSRDGSVSPNFATLPEAP